MDSGTWKWSRCPDRRRETEASGATSRTSLSSALSSPSPLFHFFSAPSSSGLFSFRCTLLKFSQQAYRKVCNTYVRLNTNFRVDTLTPSKPRSRQHLRVLCASFPHLQPRQAPSSSRFAFGFHPLSCVVGTHELRSLKLLPAQSSRDQGLPRGAAVQVGLLSAAGRLTLSHSRDGQLF